MRRLDRDEIVRLYDEEGYTFVQIAEEIGARDPAYMKYLYRRHTGREPIEQDKRSFDVGKIQALRRARWTIPSIADDCDMSPEEVTKVLKEVGMS